MPALSPRHRTALRLAALAGVLAVLWLVGTHTGFAADLSSGAFREWLVEAAGICGVLAFLAVFCAGNLMQVPGMIFVVSAILLYGRVEGAAIGLFGAILAVTVSFWTARLVGGQAFAGKRRPWLEKALGWVERRPVATIAFTRLFIQTAPPFNIALALSGVQFRDYLVGSVLGLAPPVIAAAVFIELLFPKLAGGA